MFAFQTTEFAATPPTALPPFDFALPSRNLYHKVNNNSSLFNLPGFYYDAEKNRYFPYKGPIPGSSLKPLSIPSPSHPKQADDLCQSIKIRKQKLLQARELFGDVISSHKRKLSFRAEYEKRHASQPSSLSSRKDSARSRSNAKLQGTNRGVVLLNMETRVSSWVLHSKSDVLAVQLDQSGTSILCGLRNGAIMTIDTRQRQIRRSGHSSSPVSMPSSICCLASLKLWDRYFLASSMDGSIKLYDHRVTQRGPVQSYEGNVNSHTRIELGIDPSEKVVMSGGEDCYIRLWNIKSGELLFKDRFMNSIPSTVCWPRIGGLLELTKDGQDHRCYWQDHSLGAWLGSYEGVFYMDWL
ncbi:UNVERIFIED_CONTAM: hypothetical protein Slati_1951100 [Sesamum latifolium]|uniref:Uncharacterized protein n=1 Tax=Sesamum latifolium TaxID=2727402 RepID=A0AAW2WK79_9LAMI